MLDVLAAAAETQTEMPWWSYVLFVPVFLGIVTVAIRQLTRNLKDWYEQHKEQWPRS